MFAASGPFAGLSRPSFRQRPWWGMLAVREMLSMPWCCLWSGLSHRLQHQPGKPDASWKAEMAPCQDLKRSALPSGSSARPVSSPGPGDAQACSWSCTRGSLLGVLYGMPETEPGLASARQVPSLCPLTAANTPSASTHPGTFRHFGTRTGSADRSLHSPRCPESKSHFPHWSPEALGDLSLRPSPTPISAAPVGRIGWRQP